MLALSKLNGQIHWSAELPSGMGTGFVTVLSDGSHVFAHTHGQLHCLDFATGRVLWSNQLAGCGYGIASLGLANGAFAPDPAMMQTILAAQHQAAPSGTGATSGVS